MSIKQIYMDYAAATPVDKEVLNKMLPYFSDKFYNPSSIYLSAKVVSKDIESARNKVALTLGVKPVEIIFTAGATEANNLAIHGIMKNYPCNELLISSIEHDSIMETSKKYKSIQARVQKDGRIDLNNLANKINDKTVLISVMLANNEIGTIMSIRKIAKLVETERENRNKKGNKLPIYLHTDASQAPLYIDLHVNRLGVDMMSINGGKIYGPKQSGCLYVRTGINLTSLINGGGQERGLRSGTENVANIIGFSEALVKAQEEYRSSSEKISALRDYFISNLKTKIPKVIINGSTAYRLPNNIHFTIPGIDNERIIMELDELGIQCAAGSACSASNDLPSHVLQAIGVSEQDAQSSLRFTLGKNSTKEDINYVVNSIIEVLARN